jgi:hypothetical protein
MVFTKWYEISTMVHKSKWEYLIATCSYIDAGLIGYFMILFMNQIVALL